jgi:hypothetical protein
LAVVQQADWKSDGRGPLLSRQHKEEPERDEAKRNMDQISVSGRQDRLFYDLAT